MNFEFNKIINDRLFYCYYFFYFSIHCSNHFTSLACISRIYFLVRILKSYQSFRIVILCYLMTNVSWLHKMKNFLPEFPVYYLNFWINNKILKWMHICTNEANRLILLAFFITDFDWKLMWNHFFNLFFKSLILKFVIVILITIHLPP